MINSNPSTNKSSFDRFITRSFPPSNNKHQSPNLEEGGGGLFLLFTAGTRRHNLRRRSVALRKPVWAMVRTVSVSRVLIQTATCVWVVSVATVTHIGLTQLALLYLLNWSQPWFCRSLRDDFHGKRIACKVTRFICHVIFNFFTVFHTCYLPQCAKSDATGQFEMANLIRNLRKKIRHRGKFEQSWTAGQSQAKAWRLESASVCGKLQL